jgi:hypothetical protein
MGNDMRNLILLGTIIAALTFGSVSAKASGSAAEIAVSSSSGPAVVAAAEMIESGWTSASGLPKPLPRSFTGSGGRWAKIS